MDKIEIKFSGKEEIKGIKSAEQKSHTKTNSAKKNREKVIKGEKKSSRALKRQIKQNTF